MKNKSSLPREAAKTMDYRMPIIFIAMMIGIPTLMASAEIFFAILAICGLIIYSWKSSPNDTAVKKHDAKIIALTHYHPADVRVFTRRKTA